MTQSPAPAPAFSYSFMLIFASFYFLLYKKKRTFPPRVRRMRRFFFTFFRVKLKSDWSDSSSVSMGLAEGGGKKLEN